jgi:hypothetical protein
MNRKRMFTTLVALAAVVAVIFVVGLATASEPDNAMVSDNEAGLAIYHQSDSVYARWVAQAQKLWAAKRGERQLPDSRTCVLLCGGR